MLNFSGKVNASIHGLGEDDTANVNRPFGYGTVYIRYTLLYSRRRVGSKLSSRHNLNQTSQGVPVLRGPVLICLSAIDKKRLNFF